MKADLRPLLDREYVSACVERLTFSLSQHFPALQAIDYFATALNQNDVTFFIGALMHFVGVSFDVSDVAESEQVQFAMRSLKCPFFNSSLVLGKNVQINDPVLATVLWLGYLVSYESMRISRKAQSGIISVHEQLQLSYRDFLRGFETVASTTFSSVDSIAKREGPSIETMASENAKLECIQRVLSGRETKIRESSCTKATLLQKLNGLEHRGNEALRRLQLKKRYIAKHKETLHTYLEEFRIRREEFVPNTDVKFFSKHQNIHRGTPSITERAKKRDSLHTSTELRASVTRLYTNYKSLLNELGLKSNVSTFPKADITLGTEIFAARRDLQALHLNLRDYAVRLAAESHVHAEKIQDAEGSLERSVNAYDKQFHDCNVLENCLHKSEVQYQNERQRNDAYIQETIRNLKTTEKHIHSMNQAVSAQSVHAPTGQLKSQHGEVLRTCRREKAALQGDILITLDTLMLHKQQNHEILHNWSLDE